MNETELNSIKIYKIESQCTKLLALFCPNLFSIQMIHPTRHHAPYSDFRRYFTKLVISDSISLKYGYFSGYSREIQCF